MSLDPDGLPGSIPPGSQAEPTGRRAWLAATDDPALELQSQGKVLVAALIDQLAAGQVETLHSLHTVGATVRRQTADLQNAVVAPVRQLDALLEELRILQSSLQLSAGDVVGEATARLEGLAQERLAEVHAALGVSVGPLADLVVNLQTVHEALQVSATTIVAGVTEQLTDRLEAMVELQVARANEAMAAPLEPLLALTQDLGDLQTSLEETASTIVDSITARLDARLDEMIDQRLSRAGEALAAHAGAMTTAIATAVAHAVEQLAQATDELDAAGSRVELALQQAGAQAEVGFTGFLDNLVEAGLETLEGIEHAGKSLLVRLDTEVEDFLVTLTRATELQTLRDGQVEAELSGRVRDLVDRTDLGVRRLSDRLRKETDRLVQRDEEQEQLRVASFVTTRETLLAQADVAPARRPAPKAAATKPAPKAAATKPALKAAAPKVVALKSVVTKSVVTKPVVTKPVVTKPVAPAAPVRAVAARKAPAPPVVARTARSRPSAPSK